MMMPTVLRAAIRGLALGGTVLLGACGGVGEGIAPKSSVLLPAGGEEGAASFNAYTCLNTSLVLIVDFSNGARGDFSARASWSSADETVARVSNGDIAVPDQDGFFYGRGTIIPVGPGTTTIRSSYLDFRNSIQITVSDPTNFKVTPAEADVAKGATLDLALSADLGGVNSSLDGFARWAFVTETPTVATIVSTTGTITGVGTGGPLTARARIPGCSLTIADATVNVSPLQTLALSKEFPGTDKLVVGTTERITATGTLENGRTQDLSGTVTYKAVKSEDNTTASDAATFLVGSLRNLVFASKASAAPVNLTASFSYIIDDGDASTENVSSTPVVSPVLAITPIDATLVNVTVPRTAADLAPGNSLLLKSVGDYQITTPPSSFTQDITRHVTWSIADADLATATVQGSSGTINPLAGLVLASTKAETGKTVVVTATNSNATGNKSATSTITIDPTEPQEP